MNTIRIARYEINRNWFKTILGDNVYVAYYNDVPMLFEYDTKEMTWFFMDELGGYEELTLLGEETISNITAHEKYMFNDTVSNYLNGKDSINYTTTINYELVISPNDDKYMYTLIDLDTKSFKIAKLLADEIKSNSYNKSFTIIQTLFLTDNNGQVYNCGTSKSWDL